MDLYIFRRVIEYSLMKAGISYDSIQKMGDNEVMEFVTIMNEIGEMEKDQIAQAQGGM